jgi:hypothetical protein
MYADAEILQWQGILFDKKLIVVRVEVRSASEHNFRSGTIDQVKSWR